MKIGHRPPKIYTYNGFSLTIREWAEKTGIPYSTLQSRMRGKRIRHLWTIQRALTQPADVRSPEARPGAAKRLPYGVEPLWRAWFTAPRPQPTID